MFEYAILAAIVLLGEVVGNIATARLLLRQAKILSVAASIINSAMSSTALMAEHLEKVCQHLEKGVTDNGKP